MEHPFDNDVATLQRLVLEMAKTIQNISKDHYLLGLVGSCFDTMDAKIILEELKAYNDGSRPLWLSKGDDPRSN